MQAVSLHRDQPQYLALSYCWTDAEPSCQVLINKVVAMVRPNLYAFLQRMRTEQREDWTFIDALYINQNNKVERNDQVTLMGDIYTNANNVIVLLGEKEPPDNETERQIRYVCETVSSEAEYSQTSSDLISTHGFAMTNCIEAFLDKQY